ncbi:hypothetical protein DFH06DRAFT_437148 [Mycena polygramma]|nr:hypothetical protein DFH06DRAFT_437148 [Mycena polygramma]
MEPSNLALIIAILLSYSQTVFADLIQPTATVIGSFSVVDPTSTEPTTPCSTLTSSDGSFSAFPTPAESGPNSQGASTSVETLSLPSDPPPIQSDTSPHSEFVTIMDNPVVVASVVLAIISLTILFAIFVRLCGMRRQLPTQPYRPPPPDVYKSSPSDSTFSINNVALSPWAPPTPSPNPLRAPSPVLSSYPQSPESEFQSSDIHQVQREVRELSFLQRPTSSRPASRSSLGTTITKTYPPSPVHFWLRGRYGALWDLEKGRWQQEEDVPQWQALRVKGVPTTD